MEHEEDCPKCNQTKLPFDLHCEECYEFPVTVSDEKRVGITNAIVTLGYNFERLTEGSYYSNDDSFILLVNAPRTDEAVILEILEAI